MTAQEPERRVQNGAYEAAAIALTRRDRAFDKYTLADLVTQREGHYVSSRSAGRWIRRAATNLRQLSAGTPGRGGAAARYRVSEVALRRSR